MQKERFNLPPLTTVTLYQCYQLLTSNPEQGFVLFLFQFSTPDGFIKVELVQLQSPGVPS